LLVDLVRLACGRNGPLQDVPAELGGVPGQLLGKRVGLGPPSNYRLEARDLAGLQEAVRQSLFEKGKVIGALGHRELRRCGWEGQARADVQGRGQDGA
jgi:hypothetical protein